jgi:hypothetical protein
MSTTFVPVTGTMAPLPNFIRALQNVNNVPVAVTGRSFIPPAPLPQTLIGSTTQTSYGF